MYSKDIVYFAPIGDDTVIDMIPIVEILAVKDDEEDDALKYTGELRKEKNSTLPDQSSFLRKKTYRIDKNEGAQKTANSLSIFTHPEGYNSGRKYFLQASSPDIRNEMVKELNHLSKVARKAAERKSKFQKSQAKVKRIFLSNPFHILMSVTILVV